ncbi:hypothetical protein TNCV_4860071 [Trichonephila clavipes]|nr:hypothetical protein TNCV_4860071 [Trichonephila clavipes]
MTVIGRVDASGRRGLGSPSGRKSCLEIWRGETIRKIQQMFGDDTKGFTQIKERFNRVKSGHTSVEIDQRSGRLQTARNAAVVEKIENPIMKDRRWIYERLLNNLRSIHVLHMQSCLIMRSGEAKLHRSQASVGGKERTPSYSCTKPYIQY